MNIGKILTMALATALTLGMTSNILVPDTVDAKESTETVTKDISNETSDDNKTGEISFNPINETLSFSIGL